MPGEQDVEIAILSQRVTVLEREIQELHEERKQLLRWGMITLGGATVGLGTYIWNLFNGPQPPH